MTQSDESKGQSRAQACPKCESRHWMPNLPFAPKSSVYVCVIRGALRLPSRGVTAFTTSICGDCGYSEFHATDYKAVFEEWRKYNS
ncbi:MAG: hypothetical protein V4671_04185 [Armatimonadota bacterium]